MSQDCLKLVPARFEIDLHPSRMANVAAGVQEQLNSQLFKYNPDFDGIVLCVGEYKILSRDATVHPYFPYCRLAVKAPLLVLTPQPEAILVGCVSKIGMDYIGLLVMGVLNASIPADLIRSDFVYHRPSGEWRSQRHPEHVIAVGSHVQFKVNSLQKQETFFGISGSLLGKATGCVQHLQRMATKKEAKEVKVAKATKEPKGVKDVNETKEKKQGKEKRARLS